MSQQTFELLDMDVAVTALKADTAYVDDIRSYNLEHATKPRPGVVNSSMEFVMQIPAFTEVGVHQPIVCNNIKAATSQGGHLALRAIELTSSAPVLSKLGLRDIEPETTGSSKHGTFHQLGTTMINAATRTLQSLSAHQHDIHDWSLDVTRSSKLARYHRIGFGYTLGVIAARTEQLMFDDLVHAIERRESAVRNQL